MKASRWDVSAHRKARIAHMRCARRAACMARETTGDTRRVWREHCRQHVKAARREHWILVAQSRAISAGFWLRKTIGAHGGVIRH